MIVVCDKQLSLGLFSIDEGSIWDIKEIKYSCGDVKESTVRLKERIDGFYEPMYIEIPQSFLAPHFKLYEEKIQ